MEDPENVTSLGIGLTVVSRPMSSIGRSVLATTRREGFGGFAASGATL